ALDRHGNLLIGLIGRGRLKYDALKRFFEGHIAPHSTLCTDSAHGYSRIAEELNLKHVQIESGKRKKDIYHIQHVNALHGSLKAFMRKFRGVATKHLHHYLYWFKWVELFKHEKEVVKIQKAYIHAQATYSSCSVDDILSRQPLFV
ncbi:MAG: IS1595 family transposase, partial [Faecalibacillus intestinalis]